jgi:FkbM family methyltransferase
MMPSLAIRAKTFARERSKVISDVWNHPLNRGGKILALRDYVLWNAVRFSMDSRHVVRLPKGMEIIVGPSENYGSAVYVHSLPDFGEMLLLCHLLRAGDTFVDVGANVGLYSIWVSGATGARTLAMEPVPSTFELLRKNIRLNDLDALIEPLRIAVGEHSAEVLMTSQYGGMNRVLQGSGMADVAGALRTSLAPLDDILDGRCPVAMKIDVEGFELQVLRGAASTLRDSGLKAIVIEMQEPTLNRYATSEFEVRSVLEECGFSAVVYDPFERSLSPAPAARRSFNEIFVRTGDTAIAERLASSGKVALRGYPAGI